MKKLEELSPISYKENLYQRKMELERLIKTKKTSLDHSKNLENAGHIRIVPHHNKLQFFHITKKGDTKGKYLPREKNTFAISLIEYNYDKKALASMENEHKLITKLLFAAEHNSLESITNKLSSHRYNLITPITLSNKDYENLWLSIQYNGKQFDFGNTEYFTTGGTRVRSKSELILANLLEHHHIPYRYEYPFYNKSKNITVYPDFCCLNLRTRKEIYWEHFGLMDDEGYSKKPLLKMQEYQENGLIQGKDIIYTFENSNKPLNLNTAETLIETFLT